MKDAWILEEFGRLRHQILSPEQPDALEIKQRYEAALECFEKEEFREAAAMLGNMMVDHPHDGPSLLLMSRVVDMMLHPPELGEFDQVWELDAK